MKRWSFLVVLLSLPAVAGADPLPLGEEAWPVIERGTRSGDMLARAMAAAALPDVTGRDTEVYLKEALTDPQWAVRKAAIRVLAARGDAQAKALVSDALRDPSVPLVEDAFDLVGAFKGPEGRDLFLQALLDPAVPTRAALAQALAAQPPDVAAPYFEAGLARGDELAARTLARVPLLTRDALLATLVRGRDAKAIDALLDLALADAVTLPADGLAPLLKGKDTNLKYKAAELLARGGDATAVKALRPLADGDDAARLRFLKAAAAAPSAEFHPLLKGFLAPDIPLEQHEYVYRALAGTTDPEVVEGIKKRLQATTLEVRIVATRSLAGLLGNRALPRLHELLFDGNAQVRKAAADGIAERAQAESIETLERAVRDADRDVRLAVVRALSRIRDRTVIGVASFLVYDNDPEVKKFAVLALCNANHEDALTVLRLQVQDRDPDIAREVFGALVELVPDQAAGFLETALAVLRPDDLVRLTRRFGDRFVPFLEQAAASPRSWARLAAIEAMRLVPAREAEFLKAVAATSGHADARAAALARLRALSCDTGREVALALLNDRDASVRILAARVLGCCGTPETIEPLRGALLDPEESVRVAAAANLLVLAQPKKPAPKKARSR
jgi:HEAT repeat protein